MSTLAADPGLDPERRRRRARRPGWPMWAAVAAVAVLLAGALWLRAPTIVERDGERRIINVVLPPPPPPPPPEPKPEEQPPEPKPLPVEQPQPETPPPPTPEQPSEPTQGDSALTAREGAGPSNYGLAKGDGGGTRIGGRPGGGDGLNLYGQMVYADLRRAVQDDPQLSRGRFAVRMTVWVNEDGSIRDLRFDEGSGDPKRDAALRRRLVGLTLTRRPPADLPPVRVALNSRPSL